MEAIKRYDIIRELEKVRTHKELVEILQKYPTRISVTLNFRIDNSTYVLGGNWSINNHTGELDEQDR